MLRDRSRRHPQHGGHRDARAPIRGQYTYLLRIIENAGPYGYLAVRSGRTSKGRTFAKEPFCQVNCTTSHYHVGVRIAFCCLIDISVALDEEGDSSSEKLP